MVNAERTGTTVTYSLADRRVIEALSLLRAVMTTDLLPKNGSRQLTQSDRLIQQGV